MFILSYLVAVAGAAPIPVPSALPEFRWVHGRVHAFVSQAGNYNTVAVQGPRGREIVRFCSPLSGDDLELDPQNVQYDLLKAAYLKDRDVNIGVRDFGRDAVGSPRLCIERVIF